MKILYLGDVMGEPGLQLVEKILPNLRQQETIDVVLAQAENLSDGKGVRQKDFARLRQAGVDFCTGGNHILAREESFPLLDDPNQPIIRPANYPAGTPGLGYKYLHIGTSKILVISLLGQIVGKDAEVPVDNPLKCIDEILARESHVAREATIVNFHGDFSSEKRIIGYYLDGQVTAVVGDHWHVPTADAGVLPKGTAHQTDVGMCGSLDSSLGVQFGTLIPRWRDGKITRNILETNGRMQFNALLIETDPGSKLARSARPVQYIL